MNPQRIQTNLRRIRIVLRSIRTNPRHIRMVLRLVQMSPRRIQPVIVLGTCLCTLASAQTPGPTVQWAAALADPGSAKQGSTTALELSGQILDGWHVYALTQPAGGPTALRVTLDDNAIVEAAGDPSGSTPQKKHDPSFGLETRFYTHSFTVRLPVQLKQQPASGRQLIPVSVRFQTCSDRECQPPTTIHLSVPIDVLPDA